MAKQKTPPPDREAARPPAEGYTVLARRYRPQTFTDLVGQEPVARALANAIQGGRVAHAYLFTGARGVGKTSTARILARALNCVKGPTANPCGDCEVCRSIASGEDVDVLEIDAASNRGIDNIRDIRSNVQYRPSRARYKIYIIDEVHMLTKESFNALLKTLEEPPPHVKFIFATTEVEKVPITILSRCQRFDFAGIPLPRIVERLRLIVDREGVQADAEALELIARRAGGSLRDAQSLLDQLLAFGGDRLGADQVHHLLGTAGDDRILALADAILSSDAKKALDLLDEACAGGLQLGELIDQLIAYWRDLMVVQCAGTEGRDLSVPARHHDTLRKHSKATSQDAVLAGLEVLSATRARLRGVNHARTLVEMALVRLTRLADLQSLAQLAQWLGQVRFDPRAGAAPAPTLASRAVPPEAVKKNALTSPPEGNGSSQAAGPRELNAASLPLVWPEIVAMVGGVLGVELNRAGLPAIFGPNTLVLRFPAGYNQARDYCQSQERLGRVEAALRKVTGRTWTVRVELEQGPSPGAASASSSGGEVASPRRSPREDAEKVPLVKRAVDVLGATVTRVDDGFGTAAPDETESRGDAPHEEAE
jgi:DNA polymerase-3 subunit gamma/tau